MRESSERERESLQRTVVLGGQEEVTVAEARLCGRVLDQLYRDHHVRAAQPLADFRLVPLERQVADPERLAGHGGAGLNSAALRASTRFAGVEDGAGGV